MSIIKVVDELNAWLMVSRVLSMFFVNDPTLIKEQGCVHFGQCEGVVLRWLRNLLLFFLFLFVNLLYHLFLLNDFWLHFDNLAENELGLELSDGPRAVCEGQR